MRIIFQSIVLLLAAVAQVTVFPFLLGDRVNVDLVLLLVVAWGIIKGVQQGLLWGLIGGMILDAVSNVPFGTTTVVLGAIGVLGGLRVAPAFRSSMLSAVVLTVLATIAYDGLLAALLALFERDGRWLAVLGDLLIPAVIANAVAMIPVFWLLRRIHRRFQPSRIGGYMV